MNFGLSILWQFIYSFVVLLNHVDLYKLLLRLGILSQKFSSLRTFSLGFSWFEKCYDPFGLREREGE